MIGFSGHRVGECATVGHERRGNEYLRRMFVHDGLPVRSVLAADRSPLRETVGSQLVEHSRTREGPAGITKRRRVNILLGLKS